MNDKHILVMHGRQDRLIPIVGGVDKNDQWMYEPEDNMLRQWAVIQQCDMTSY